MTANLQLNFAKNQSGPGVMSSAVPAGTPEARRDPPELKQNVCT